MLTFSISSIEKSGIFEHCLFLNLHLIKIFF